MELMSDAEKALREVLTRELAVVEDLLTLAYQLTEALKIDDVERVAELTQKQQLLAARLEAVEGQRLKELAAFVRERRLEAEPTLGELLQDTELTEEFRDVAQSLWDKFQLLQEQHELNGMLLNQSLQYTRKMLGIFNQGATYQPDGTVEQLQVSSALVDKSV
ncbi:MAG: flagellar protein FlgN [Clostridia bacterium]|nr:flagellar protein FlgN [Clostridia bacterium]